MHPHTTTQAYYDRDKGIGYTLVRTSIHSCDFSPASFTYVADGDANLETFSIAPDLRLRIPLIKRAVAVAGEELLLYASPWSPPAFMKDTKRMLEGGKLLPEYYAAWAEYYARFVLAYEAEGLPVWGLTVQNEPMAVQRWESCIWTAEEERDFVKAHLGPTLARHGLQVRSMEERLWAGTRPGTQWKRYRCPPRLATGLCSSAIAVRAGPGPGGDRAAPARKQHPSPPPPNSIHKAAQPANPRSLQLGPRAPSPPGPWPADQLFVGHAWVDLSFVSSQAAHQPPSTAVQCPQTMANSIICRPPTNAPSTPPPAPPSAAQSVCSSAQQTRAVTTAECHRFTAVSIRSLRFHAPAPSAMK